MRLFIALDIDPDIRKRIAEFRDQMRSLAPDVRWVGPETFHITLQFLGETDKLDDIRKALEQIKAAQVPLTFRGAGFFPNSEVAARLLGWHRVRRKSPATGQLHRHSAQAARIRTRRRSLQAAPDSGPRRQRAPASSSWRARSARTTRSARQSRRPDPSRLRYNDGTRVLSLREQAVAKGRAVYQAVAIFSGRNSRSKA